MLLIAFNYRMNFNKCQNKTKQLSWRLLISSQAHEIKKCSSQNLIHQNFKITYSADFIRRWRKWLQVYKGR